MLDGIRPYLWLSLLCLVLYLPGLAALPPLDRDESRFAQATAQMLESRDFIDIRFQGTPRHKKPAGIYWLQAAAVSALSAPDARAIWAYRVPSVVGAWAAVLLTFAAGAGLFGRRAAFVAAGLLAASVMVVLEAHQAKTDAVLLATVAASQAVLARFYAHARLGAPAPGWGSALAFWAAQGAGILVKGPIAPLVALTTVAALVLADRDRTWLKGLRPLAGLAVVAAMVGPWLWAVQTATGGAFVDTAVSSDLLPKLLGAQESHGAPPGYFLILVFFLFWPGSLFLVPALVRAWSERRDPAIRFALAWLVPAWGVFEIVPTKLPHYTLPLYPALALLTAAAVVAGADVLRRRWATALWVPWAIAPLGLAAAAVVLPVRFGAGFVPATLAGAILAVAVVVVALRAAAAGAFAAAAAAMVGIGGVLLAATLQIALPRIDAAWVSRDVAAAIGDHAGPVAAAGYHEPSLVFLLGTETKLVDGAAAAAYLAATGSGAVAVVEDREADPFRAAAAGLDLATVATVAGFNYSKGKPVRLTVYRRRT